MKNWSVVFLGDINKELGQERHLSGKRLEMTRKIKGEWKRGSQRGSGRKRRNNKGKYWSVASSDINKEGEAGETSVWKTTGNDTQDGMIGREQVKEGLEGREGIT